MLPVDRAREAGRMGTRPTSRPSRSPSSLSTSMIGRSWRQCDHRQHNESWCHQLLTCLKQTRATILVDTGYDREWDAFCGESEKAGVGFGDLKYLILTHHHERPRRTSQTKLVAYNPRIKIVMS